MPKQQEPEKSVSRYEEAQLAIARKALAASRITVLIALLTCVAIVVFNYLSQKSTQKAIEISTRSLQLAHRPYLSIRGPDVEPREPHRHNLFLKLDLKNVGTVPANILGIEFKPNERLKSGVVEETIFKPSVVFPGESCRFEVDFTFRSFGITREGEEPGFEITVQYCGTDSSHAKYITYKKYSFDSWREVLYINGDSAFAN
jgi:hypothetical protein